MTIKPNILVPFLLFSILLSATLVLSYHSEDPELKQCKQECQQQPHYDQGMRKQCERRCEKQQQEKEEQRGRDHHEQDPERQLQQCRQECRERHEGERKQEKRCESWCEAQFEKQQQQQKREGESRGSHETPHRDPQEQEQEQLQQCRQQCQERHQGEEQQLRGCERQCKDKYQQQQREEEEEEEEQGGHEQDTSREDHELKKCRQTCQEHGRPRKEQCERECEEKYSRRTGRGGGEGNSRGEEGNDNPYFFGRDRFKEWVGTEHGRVQVLERFDKQSDLLIGIANYRLAVFEANPHTFVMPDHWDAEAVLFVANGRGIISLLNENGRESHELRQGDIFRIPAGRIVYLINKDSNEKLYVVKLLQPVSTPGHFETFFDAGGEDPETYYQSFSNEVLEAAFNTKREKIERVFGKQRKGVVFRASEGQIRALSRKSSEGGPWPWGGGESQQQRPFNLLEKRPTHANNRGKYFLADARDYQQLRDLDIQIAYANISCGSMLAPHYNSRVTRVSLVLKGRGSVEIVCPHLASQRSQKREGREDESKKEGHDEQQGQQDQRYARAQSNVSPGTVVVTPAGHPAVWIASRNENLEVIGFDINARGNQKYWLAGRNNILKKLEKTAKELAFDSTEEEVDELLNAQDEEVFVQGPQERRERRHGGSLASILDFAGF